MTALAPSWLCVVTPTNTGHLRGAVVELEKNLDRKLHKIGCLLHWNELPLRQVICVLDGDTQSGNKWTGPISSRVSEDLHQHQPVAFNKGSSPLRCSDDDVLNKLSRDQHVLLETVLAVSSGDLEISKFAYAKVGLPNMARWLTLAERILQM